MMKKQILLVSCLCASYVLISPLVKELYPFSMATMFAFPLNRLYIYDARNAKGMVVGETWFYSTSDNLFDPPPMTLGRTGYGRRETNKLCTFDKEPPYAKKVSEQELRNFVLKRLEEEPDLGYVSVSQNLIEPVATDPKHLDPVWSKTIKMDNPYYRGK